MVNLVILTGRVGNDPDGKQISDNFYVASLSLATSEKFKKDGQIKEVTEWHKLKFFNKLASDVVMKYVKKGDLINIIGKIHYSKVEKDGKTTYFTEINVNEMKMLPSGKKDESKPADVQDKTEDKKTDEPEPIVPESDDLPF